MPTVPRPYCRVPGCKHRAAAKSSYCAEHGPQQRNAIPDNREHSAARGYGHAWRKTRERWLQQHPLCVMCMGAGLTVVATIVDHIIPLAVGGADDATNYQSLCHTCHNRKTAAERARGIVGKGKGSKR